MDEKEFGEFLKSELIKYLPRKYKVETFANLYYKLSINNKLEIEQDPKNPKRGSSAFQTDLLISEIRKDLSIPKVVIELKHGISTHDVITYSYKALLHKEVYPYIRYGMVMFDINYIPKRFFIHNQNIDFCIALKNAKISDLLKKEVKRQIKLSDQIEKNIFHKTKITFYSDDKKFE